MPKHLLVDVSCASTPTHVLLELNDLLLDDHCGANLLLFSRSWLDIRWIAWIVLVNIRWVWSTVLCPCGTELGDTAAAAATRPAAASAATRAAAAAAAAALAALAF